MQSTNKAFAYWAIPFFTIWTGQALSQLGSRAASFALVWWMTETTGSATVVAIATLFSFLPQVVLGPFVGVLVDRWSRRIVMIVSDVIVALTMAWLATRFWTGGPEVWHVYLGTFISALGGTFQFTVLTATTTLMVPETHLGRVQGINQAFNGVLNMGGPPLGALLIALIPISGILSLDVITAALAIIPLFFIAIPQPQRTEHAATGVTPSILADFRAGLRYIWGWSGLRMIIIYSAIFNFIANPAISLLPLLTVNHFGGEALQLSWLQAALGIGTVSGGMVLGIGNGFQRRRIHAALTSAAGADLGLFLIGIAPATALWLALSGIFFLGFMNALVNGISTALLQARIASDLQGRVFSVLLSGSQILTLVGLAVVGPITDLVGIRTWFIIGSLAAVLLTVTMFFVPAVMQLEDKGSGQS